MQSISNHKVTKILQKGFVYRQLILTNVENFVTIRARLNSTAAQRHSGVKA